MTTDVRRPVPGDAPGVFALMAAGDIAAIGHPDVTLEDAVDTLTDPTIDLARDAWVAENDRGEIVGCAFVHHRGDSDVFNVDIHVDPSEHALEPQLWETAEARAVEVARGLGHRLARLDAQAYRGDGRRSAFLASRGYAVATTFYRMRIDHHGAMTEAGLPPGVGISVAGGDEQLRREAHAVHMSAFASHFGFAAQTYEEWAARIDASVATGWDLVRLATVDGAPAGVLMETTHYIPDDNCGYVSVLGVLDQFRGRGLGKALLLDVCARDAAAGRAGTSLHVDVNNATPALGMYEAVGMRPVLVVDGWRRTVEP